MKAFPVIAIASIFFVTLGLAACDINEGPAEEAGESIDNAVDNTGDAIKDATN